MLVLKTRVLLGPYSLVRHDDEIVSDLLAFPCHDLLAVRERVRGVKDYGRCCNVPREWWSNRSSL